MLIQWKSLTLDGVSITSWQQAADFWCSRHTERLVCIYFIPLFMLLNWQLHLLPWHCSLGFCEATHPVEKISMLITRRPVGTWHDWKNMLLNKSRECLYVCVLTQFKHHLVSPSIFWSPIFLWRFVICFKCLCIFVTSMQLLCKMLFKLMYTCVAVSVMCNCQWIMLTTSDWVS